MTKEVEYVVIEGPDCAGKTTLAEQLCKETETICIKEPWSVLGKIALKTSNPVFQTVLFVLDRVFLHKFVVRRMRGRTIISDRSYVSTLAYQGRRSRLATLIATLYAPRIDLLILLLPPPEVLVERCKGRRESFDPDVREAYKRVVATLVAEGKVEHVVVLG